MDSSLRRIIDLVEAAQKAVPDYDLQARYDQFNRAYFNGSLPTIPLSFADLKSVGGKVAYRLKRVGPAPDPRMVRFGRVSKYHNCVLDSMRLVLSTRFKRTNEHLDGILLHEMIHVHFLNIGDFDESHGGKFLKMRRELSQLSGINVPLRDTIDSLELANPKAVTAVGVLLLTKKEGGHSFTIFSAKMAHAQSEEIEKYWDRRVGFAKVELYTVATPGWTEASAKFKVARTMKSGLYRMVDPELVTDLQTNGHKLWEVIPRF